MAAILERLLRVPEAWQACLDAEWLESVLPEKLPAYFGASHLAALLLVNKLQLQLDRELPEIPSLDHLQARLETRAETNPLERFQALAMYAAAQARKAHELVELTPLLDEILKAPSAGSIVALAWTWFPDPQALLHALWNAQRSDSQRLAIQMLLANLPPDQAAEIIQATLPESADLVLEWIQRLDEHTVRDALLSMRNEHPKDGETPQLLNANPIQELRQQALRARIEGDYHSAQSRLDLAWDQAAQSSALIADDLAELALAEGDPVTSLEARRSAYHTHPSPRRRVNLGLALLDQGELEAARSLARDFNHSPESGLLEGLADAQQSPSPNTRKKLELAVVNAAEAFQGVPPGIQRWLAALETQGARQKALELAQLWVARTPANIEARFEMARLYQASGDPHSASSETALILELQPDFAGAQRLLAHCLQSQNLYADALRSWTNVECDAPDEMFHRALAALQAGEIELAKTWSRELQERYASSGLGEVLLGKIHQQQEDWDAAEALFEKAIGCAPQEAQAWVALIQLEQTRQSNAKVETIFQRALQAVPHSPWIATLYALQIQSQGQPSRALEFIERALDLDPDDLDARLLHARLLLDLGHLELARDSLLIAHDRFPLHNHLNELLAEAHERNGDLSAALDVLPKSSHNQNAYNTLLRGRIMVQSALETKDQDLLNRALILLETVQTASRVANPEASYWLARLHEAQGRMELALAGYQACIQMADSLPPGLEEQALIGSARVNLERGQHSLALIALEEARTRFANTPTTLRYLAQAYLQANLAQESFSAARQAHDQDPTYESKLLLAQSAIAADQSPIALEMLDDILQLVDVDMDTWVQLLPIAEALAHVEKIRQIAARILRFGRQSIQLLLKVARVLSRSGEFLSGMNILEYVTRREPQNTAALSELASIAEQTGKFDRALSAWSQIVDLDPDDERALAHSAKLLWESGQQTAALGHWERAAVRNPKDLALQKTIARAYIENGEFQKGLNTYVRAVELDPSNAELSFEAGTLALKHDALDEARHYLEQALSLDPDQGLYRTTLAECHLLSRRWKDLIAVLQGINAEPEQNPNHQAMLTLAFLESNDLTGARTAFDTMLDFAPGADLKQPWTILAALRLCEWNAARQIIESAPKDQIAIWQAWFELCLWETTQVLAAAGVRDRLPKDALSRQELVDLLQSLDLDGNKKGSDRAILDRLAQRKAVLAQKIETEPPADTSNLTLEVAQTAAICAVLDRQPYPFRSILESCQLDARMLDLRNLILPWASFSEGQVQDATSILESLKPDPMQRPIIEAWQGRLAAVQGQPEANIHHLQTALLQWPDEADWQAQLGRLMLDRHKYDAAIAHLEHATSILPDDHRLQLDLARARAKAGMLSESSQAYEAALQDNPQQASIWREAGDVALANGQLDRAETWFERACSLDPSDPYSLVGAARVASLAGNSRLSGERIESALRLAPDSPEVHLMLGEILSGQGKPERALKAFAKAAQVAPDPAPALQARATLLIQLGQAQHAVAELQQALRLKPHDEQLLATMATAAEAAGDFTFAEKTVGKALENNPANPVLLIQSARLSRLQGQLDKALDICLKARQSDPTEPSIQLELGHIYRERRDYDRALAAYNQSIDLDSRSEPAYFHAGLLLKDRKRYQEAGEMLRRAVDINPGHHQALQQLAAVRALELVHGSRLTNTVVT